MPFYEYQCKLCGHHLEAMQKVNDHPLKKCPDCGKSALQRLMSAPVFRLKGGGWYETDFKSDGEGKRNLADRPEAQGPKDEKGQEAKAKDDKQESKPADANGAGPAKDEKKPAEKAAAPAAEKAGVQYTKRGRRSAAAPNSKPKPKPSKAGKKAAAKR